jgi:hypothetical protein
MVDSILVELFDTRADEVEIDRLTRVVRQELLEIDDVDAVTTPETGPAPEGSRGLALGALGALVISAQPTVEVLTRVFGVIRTFVSRAGADRKMRLTVNGHSIELLPTDEQQQVLVERFLAEALRAAPDG